MDAQQQRILANEIGGEPLEGSGFESERSVAEDEIVVADSEGQAKGKEI